MKSLSSKNYKETIIFFFKKFYFSKGKNWTSKNNKKMKVLNNLLLIKSR